MDVWRRMIRAQGGDPDAPLPTARETAGRRGAGRRVSLAGLDAYAVGVAAWRLGAGRARKEDPVQAGAGVEMHAKPGAEVRGGRAAAHPAHRRRRSGSPAPRRRSRTPSTIAPEGSRPDRARRWSSTGSAD